MDCQRRFVDDEVRRPVRPRRDKTMLRAATRTLLATAAVAAVACASTTFHSTWRNPAAEPGNFKGQKVCALIVSKEEGVRYGAEDALAHELTKRGAVGIAAYTLVPRELIQDKDKAREFLEKAGVKGVVAMRVVGKDKEITSSPGAYYATPYYSSFWGPGYWGWSWGGVYSPGYIQTETKVIVETLVYSLPQNKLVWAGQSETTNPSKVGPFIQDLVSKAAAEMKKQGLIR
jgi:hypothetical protein